AMLGTTAAAHSSPATVYPLQTKLAVGSFPRDFFGSPASGAWSLPVLLPNARVTAAELFVTNSSASSPTAVVAVAHTLDCGLLTGARVTLDITQVGETNPGSDLTVIIRL